MSFLFFPQPAFNGRDLAYLCRSILEDTPVPLPPHYSPYLSELIFSMLNKDKNARPTVENILSHHVFTAKLQQARSLSHILPQTFNPGFNDIRIITDHVPLRRQESEPLPPTPTSMPNFSTILPGSDYPFSPHSHNRYGSPLTVGQSIQSPFSKALEEIPNLPPTGAGGISPEPRRRNRTLQAARRRGMHAPFRSSPLSLERNYSDPGLGSTPRDTSNLIMSDLSGFSPPRSQHFFSHVARNAARMNLAMTPTELMHHHHHHQYHLNTPPPGSPVHHQEERGGGGMQVIGPDNPMTVYGPNPTIQTPYMYSPRQSHLQPNPISRDV